MPVPWLVTPVDSLLRLRNAPCIACDRNVCGKSERYWKASERVRAGQHLERTRKA